MTIETRVILLAGELVKTWARAQTEQLLAEGANEEEAREVINSIMATAEFRAEINGRFDEIRAWVRRLDQSDARTLH